MIKSCGLTLSSIPVKHKNAGSLNRRNPPFLFSRAPRLCKRVCPSVRRLVHRSVGPSVGPSVRNAFVSAGRDEPANDLFRVIFDRKSNIGA